MFLGFLQSLKVWAPAESTISNDGLGVTEDQQEELTQYNEEGNNGGSGSNPETTESMKGRTGFSSRNGGRTAKPELASAVAEDMSSTQSMVARDLPNGSRLNGFDDGNGRDKRVRRKRELDDLRQDVQVLQNASDTLAKENEGLKKQNERLKKESERCRKDNERLRKDDEHWRKENEHWRKENENFKYENDRLQKRLQEGERRWSEMEGSLKVLKSEGVIVSQELASAQRREEELKGSHDRQAKELSIIKGELRRAEAQHGVTNRLLEERTLELKGAELFINLADSLSGAEVIRMAEALNAEILQGAAFMADAVKYSQGMDQTPADTAAAKQGATMALGDVIVKALWSGRTRRGDDFDPTIVQIALQTSMVYCCEIFIRSWTAKNYDTELLGSIYERIYHKETQAVAGRWRSMARASVDGRAKTDFQYTTMIDALIKVLVVAGCSKQETNPNAFFRKFQERLSMIINLTTRLQSAVGQEITSTDIHPWVFSAGEIFDPSTMEDTYGEERNSINSQGTRGRIAGTTELGLYKKTKDTGGPHFDILLKPKIVLCSALSEEVK